MNLYFRLLILIIKNFFRQNRVNIFDEVKTTFRVLPNDLDLNMHMNNGRYLTIMDLGRFDYMSQVGILTPAIKRKWLPVLGAVQMTFLRPLKPFKKFQLITQIEYWDEKWFVMKQKFVIHDKLIAVGRIRGQMRGPNGLVKPEEILALVDSKEPSPQLNDELKKWLESLEKKPNA